MHLSMTHGETIIQPSRAADGASLDLLPNLAITLPAQAAEDDLTATVEEQIRAFARSINKGGTP